MNEDYNALKQLQKTINTIKELENEYDTLTTKKAKIAATTVDYKHGHFPFAKAVKDLEAKAKSKSIGTAMTRLSITLLFSLLIAGLMTGIYYVLYTQNIIPAFLADYHTYILIAIPTLVIIITYILSHKKIKHFLIEHRKKHIISKHKDTLKDAKEHSIEEADRYQLELNARVKTINQDLKTIETNIKGHKHILEKQPPLPEKFIPALDDIIMYFDDKRTDSLKDAINLYVKESQEKTRFTRLLYAIKDDTMPIEALLDESTDLDTYKTRHVTNPEPISKPDDSVTEVLGADKAIEDLNHDNQETPPPEGEPKDKKPSKKPSKKHEDLTVYTKE